MALGSQSPDTPPNGSGQPVVRVYVPAPFRRVTAGEAHVTATASSVVELVAELERRYPGFSDLVWAEGDLIHHINVYVNGIEVRSLRGRDTALGASDEIAFVPMLAGGS